MIIHNGYDENFGRNDPMPVFNPAVNDLYGSLPEWFLAQQMQLPAQTRRTPKRPMVTGRILSFLEDGKEHTTPEIADSVGTSRESALSLLLGLKDKGQVVVTRKIGKSNAWRAT